MTEPDPFHKYGELAAGHALPTTVHPNISAPVAPTTPTDRMMVDGVELAPASRLLALAATRDQHRAAARSANDRMHECRERVEENQRRVRQIVERVGRDLPPNAAAEVAQIEVDQAQWQQARATAQAEAEVASTAWHDAYLLLKSAIRFAREVGATIPSVLQGEVR